MIRKIIYMCGTLFAFACLSFSSFAKTEQTKFYPLFIGINPEGSLTAIVGNAYQTQVEILDTKNPQEIKILSTIPLQLGSDIGSGGILSSQIFIRGFKLYVLLCGHTEYELFVYDISNSVKPIQLGHLKIDKDRAIYPMAVMNDNIFLIYYDHWTATIGLNLYQFDASGMLNSTPVYSRLISVRPTELAVQGNQLYVRENNTLFSNRSLVTYDISNLTDWQEVNSFLSPGDKLSNFQKLTPVTQTRLFNFNSSSSDAEIFEGGVDESHDHVIPLNFINNKVNQAILDMSVNVADDGGYILTWDVLDRSQGKSVIYFTEWYPNEPGKLITNTNYLANAGKFAVSDRGVTVPKLFVISAGTLSIYTASRGPKDAPQLLGQAALS